MGLFDFLRPKGRLVVEQAEGGGAHASTPIPRFDDYGGDSANLSAHFYANDGPTPAHIEWLFGLSDEFARVVQRLRMEVWRRGLRVEPVHQKYCTACGEGIDDDAQPCPGCQTMGTGVPPNPEEKAILQDFVKQANKSLRQTLAHVGERKTEEGLKHGRSYAIFKLDMELDADGIMRESRVVGVFAGASGLIVRLEPDSTFICLRCRGDTKYKPEKEAGRCPGCNYMLYEAWYAQHSNIMGGAVERYWLPEEVCETRWPYTDGSSPVRRLWPKASTLLMMDWYAAWALDPKRDKRPDKILVTMGGDKKSIMAWAKMDAEERKKNPYKPSHLHIETPPGGLVDLKAAVEVIDLGETEFKGQMLDLRREFESAIRKHYGLSALQAGDTDEKGGLGTSTVPQGDSTAQVVESIQSGEDEWLHRLSEKLGAKQWHICTTPARDEEDGADAETMAKWLDVASKAADRGLPVQWREGRPIIGDGPIEKSVAPNPFGGMDGQGGEDPGGDGSEESFLRQAISDSDDVTKGVLLGFEEMPGVVADEAFDSFAGLTPQASAEVRREIVASLRQPQGWSTDSIVARIAKHWIEAGFEDGAAMAHAETAARTEVRSIASEFKRRLWHREEAERGKVFHYHIRGASDARTTKLSHWTRLAVGSGKPLAELERILDEGVRLAREGAFWKGGALSGVQGRPIRLPADFRRRGFLIHFNDRDQVFRVA